MAYNSIALITGGPTATISLEKPMKKTPVSSAPVAAPDPDASDPFAWPRKPTPPLVQVPFNFEAIEPEGDTACE